MVPLAIVRESNARLRELGPGLVALFVGGTSGVGEYTLKAFVENSIAPRAYLIGRNETAATKIIDECAALNKDGKVVFFKADVSELSEVDRVCKEIQQRESHINLIVQTQGNLNFRGRDDNPEGLPRKFVLNYWSRMRFLSNLLPQLRTASTTSPHFARHVSVLGVGTAPGTINMKDVGLQNTFSAGKCATHTITMNDLMAEQYGAREPGITFIHTYPLVVDTGAARELPLWARGGAKVLLAVLKPWVVGREETGQRQLFHATSAMFPPAWPAAKMQTARGVSLASGVSVGIGAAGQSGSGGYLVNWNGDRAKKASMPSGMKEQEVSEAIWERTAEVFRRVDQIHAERSS